GGELELRAAAAEDSDAMTRVAREALGEPGEREALSGWSSSASDDRAPCHAPAAVLRCSGLRPNFQWHGRQFACPGAGRGLACQREEAEESLPRKYRTP